VTPPQRKKKPSTKRKSSKSDSAKSTRKSGGRSTAAKKPTKGSAKGKGTSRKKSGGRKKSSPALHAGALFIGLTLGAIVLGGLYYFWKMPLHLEAESRQRLQDVRAFFSEPPLASAELQVDGPAVRMDEEALWEHYAIAVQAPETIKLQAVDDMLRRDLPRSGISVEAGEGAERERRYTLYMRDRPFADLVVRGGSPRSPVRQAKAAPSPKAVADLSAQSRRTQKLIREALVDYGVPLASIHGQQPARRSDSQYRWLEEELSVALPNGVDAKAAGERLRKALSEEPVNTAVRERSGGVVAVEVEHQRRRVARVEMDPAPVYDLKPLDWGDLQLDSAHPGAPVEQPVNGAAASHSEAAVRSQPRIAIIVDDGGYGGETTEEIFSIDAPLTLAILPFTPEARETARRAKQSGFEVMLHMPMENGSADRQFPGTIRADMPAAEVRKHVLAALSQVPGAVGVNNHTGSVFTANAPAMERFLDALPNKDLYIIDSRTTAETKAFATARRRGRAAASNNLFLDNEADPAYIRGKLHDLAGLARERGSAIGICHFRPSTAMVLKEEVPRLQRQGVRIVPASQLVEEAKPAPVIMNPPQ
jgi:hypothetical protein